METADFNGYLAISTSSRPVGSCRQVQQELTQQLKQNKELQVVSDGCSSGLLQGFVEPEGCVSWREEHLDSLRRQRDDCRYSPQSSICMCAAFLDDRYI